MTSVMSESPCRQSPPGPVLLPFAAEIASRREHPLPGDFSSAVVVTLIVAAEATLGRKHATATASAAIGCAVRNLVPVLLGRPRESLTTISGANHLPVRAGCQGPPGPSMYAPRRGR